MSKVSTTRKHENTETARPQEERRGIVTSAGCQVILCDPIWHVSSRSGEAGVLRT